MNRFGILVAGGQGSRMQTDVPKQFLSLKGKPIIIHSMQAFLDFDPEISLVIVLPKDHLDQGQQVVEHYLPSEFSRTKFCVGGASRFQSVRNGLSQLLSDEGTVAIHDAVRPLVTPGEIGKTFQMAEQKGSAVLVTAVKESLRKMEGERSAAVPRALYRSVQTPQTFSLRLLKEAYLQEEISEFTDDASVFERAGHQIQLVEGSYRNIKITTPEDLLTAEVMLS